MQDVTVDKVEFLYKHYNSHKTELKYNGFEQDPVFYNFSTFGIKLPAKAHCIYVLVLYVQ